MTTAEIMVALRARFAPPAWAYIPQVANGTGRYGTRIADAVAMSIWPSRGLNLHGFEVKVSRSDWLRELKDPAKAEAVQPYCDRWWIVAGDKSIVLTGELPATWGLLVPRGRDLIAQVEAPQLEAKPIDRVFLAALLRRAAEAVVPKAEIDAAVEREREEIRASIERGEAWKRQRSEEEIARLRKNIAEFEQASGLTLGDWDHGRIGAAVKAVLQGAHGGRDFRHLAQRSREIADLADAAAVEMDARSVVAAP